MKPATLFIGAIHIVESLGPDDEKTGTSLHDLLSALVAERQERLALHHWQTRTRDDLMAVLSQIEEVVKSTRLAPILHLEAHGNKMGLGLASGFVPWADLKAPLTRINILCRLNLLVVVAACDGEASLSTIFAHDRAPVWGIIGPNRKVLESEIATAN